MGPLEDSLLGLRAAREGPWGKVRAWALAVRSLGGNGVAGPRWFSGTPSLKVRASCERPACEGQRAPALHSVRRSVQRGAVKEGGFLSTWVGVLLVRNAERIVNTQHNPVPVAGTVTAGKPASALSQASRRACFVVLGQVLRFRPWGIVRQ